MPEVQKRFTERRKGPDAVVKAVWWTAGISWLLFVAALIFVETARPEIATFFDRQFNISIRDYWDENVLLYVFIILVLNFAVCVIGFIFNMARHKGKRTGSTGPYWSWSPLAGRHTVVPLPLGGTAIYDIRQIMEHIASAICLIGNTYKKYKYVRIVLCVPGRQKSDHF